MADSRLDEAVALSAQRGSLADFVVLHDRYQRRIYNFIGRRVPIGPDVEDLTQEAFVRAWQRIDSYEPSRRFSTWLFTIAARLTIDFQRSAASARRLHGALAMAPSSRSTNTNTSEDDHLIAEGAGLWALARRALTADQHTALWLRYAEGLEIHEIATVMGRSNVAARVMLHRARRALERAARATDGELIKNRPLVAVMRGSA